MGKLRLYTTDRAQFNDVDGDPLCIVTESDQALKVVNPPTNDQRQNDFPNNSAWSEMLGDEIGNQSQPMAWPNLTESIVVVMGSTTAFRASNSGLLVKFRWHGHGKTTSNSRDSIWYLAHIVRWLKMGDPTWLGHNFWSSIAGILFIFRQWGWWGYDDHSKSFDSELYSTGDMVGDKRCGKLNFLCRESVGLTWVNSG